MSATDDMTTREIADYLAKQQAKNWPMSLSIKPRNWGQKHRKGREHGVGDQEVTSE